MKNCCIILEFDDSQWKMKDSSGRSLSCMISWQGLKMYWLNIYCRTHAIANAHRKIELVESLLRSLNANAINFLQDTTKCLDLAFLVMLDYGRSGCSRRSGHGRSNDGSCCLRHFFGVWEKKMTYVVWLQLRRSFFGPSGIAEFGLDDLTIFVQGIEER